MSKQVLFKSDKGTVLVLKLLKLLSILPYNAMRTIKHLYFICMLLLLQTTIGVLPSTITTTHGNRISIMAIRTIYPVEYNEVVPQSGILRGKQ